MLQAVSYEFQHRRRAICSAPALTAGSLFSNGIVGPLLLGGAVATFFNGSNFIVEKASLTNLGAPVISSWANASAGLDALLDPWNLIFGLAVMFLPACSASFTSSTTCLTKTSARVVRCRLVGCTVPFLVLFLAFFVAHPAEGRLCRRPRHRIRIHGADEISPQLSSSLCLPYPLTELAWLLLLYGVLRTIISPSYVKGIWPAGIGVVLVVVSLLLVAGLADTAYYPSNVSCKVP